MTKYHRPPTRRSFSRSINRSGFCSPKDCSISTSNSPKIREASSGFPSNTARSPRASLAQNVCRFSLPLKRILSRRDSSRPPLRHYSLLCASGTFRYSSGSRHCSDCPVRIWHHRVSGSLPQTAARFHNPPFSDTYWTSPERRCNSILFFSHFSLLIRMDSSKQAFAFS